MVEVEALQEEVLQEQALQEEVAPSTPSRGLRAEGPLVVGAAAQVQQLLQQGCRSSPL